MKFFKYAGLILNSVLCIIYGLIKYFKDPHDLNNNYLVGRFFARTTLKIIGAQLEMTGAVHNLKNDRPIVIIANHQHNFDLVLGASLIKPNTVSMGKIELRDIPIFGFLYEKFGNILVNRHNPKVAIRQLDTAVQKILRDKTSIFLFPEGKRNTSTHLEPFKRGALIAAFKSGAPILPIAIERYVEKESFKNLKNLTIKIKVLDLIETKEMSSVDQRRLMTEIQTTMEDEIQKL